MMYSTPFLLRVLGLLWLVLGLLGLLSVSALLKAQLPRSPSVVVSRGLVPLGWPFWPKAFLVCAAGEENFAVCVRQARSHLFACVDAGEDPDADDPDPPPCLSIQEGQ